MFKIGDFSKLSSTSIRMLRHYDEIDLLKPSTIDDMSNFRYYSANQLERVNKINLLKKLGFSLAIIREILDKDIEDIQSYFEIRQRELVEELEAIQSQTKQLESLQATLSKHKEIINYHVQYKIMPKQKVMSMRKTVKNFSDEHALWQQMYEESKKQRIKFPANSIGISIYHDKEFKEELVDIEIQSTINKLYSDTEDITFYEVPETIVASVIFHGSFDQMPQVTMAIAKWIEVNNYKIKGHTWVISHVSPAMDNNPDHWISEVCYPIK
ncbi:MAG: MerR family transcriptional regulator [Coprobacillaceae bacterium]